MMLADEELVEAELVGEMDERNVALERLAEAKAQRDAEMKWIDE